MDISNTAMIHYKNLTTQKKATPPRGNDQELKQACKDFEAIFIKQMLDAMRKTVPDSGLLEKDQAQEIFEDMLYDKYASLLSETANLGIADIMYKQLSNYNNTNGKVY